MRILSKFHDYYDTAIGYGIDKERVYERNKEVRCVDDMRTLFVDHNGCHVTLFVIGFCGELFGVAEVEGKYFYNFKGLDAFTLSKKYQSRYNIHRSLIHSFLDGRVEQSLRDNTWHRDIPDFNSYFRKYNVPIFTVKVASSIISEWSPKLVLNPKLKDLEFYRIKDAFTAYQEIDMYLHNELANPDNPHIDPIPDQLRAESHGFDKYSFRKDKTKHN